MHYQDQEILGLYDSIRRLSLPFEKQELYLKKIGLLNNNFDKNNESPRELLLEFSDEYVNYLSRMDDNKKYKTNIYKFINNLSELIERYVDALGPKLMTMAYLKDSEEWKSIREEAQKCVHQIRANSGT